MTHFYVDDQLAFHPKVIAAGNAAMGLWVRAGAICKQHTTGGYVALEVALALGKRADVDALVNARLWIPVPGGFQFHDWADVAGNSTADDEKARRDAERERARIRKADQRARQKEESHAVSHAVTEGGTQGGSHAVSPGRVTAPPVPVPLTKDTHVRPEPKRESYPQATDDDDLESICTRQVANLGVDFGKVKTAIAKACGRVPGPTAVVQIVATIIDRATPPVKSPTGLVLKAIQDDWAEWQKFLDQAVAA